MQALLDATPILSILDSARPSCAYVIGNNGVGKSFLLRGLVDHYIRTGRSVKAISSTTSDRYPPSSNDKPNYLYMGSRTTAGGTSTRLLGHKILGLLQTIHREPYRLDVFERVAELVGFSAKYFVLPKGLKASSNSLVEVRTIEEMKYSEIPKGDQPGFQRGDSTVIVPFDHLSSGEQQILLLLGRLVAEAHNGALFIIDEPEASLHVAWQRALPGAISLVRDAFQAYFAIATHSPVLLSAAAGTDNYRFSARGGVIEPLPEYVRSVERILFDGFDTYTDGSREVHERCAEIVSSVIERFNLGEPESIDQASGELEEMRRIVELSIPSLGVERTAAHLHLIERAAFVLSGLEDERAPRDATNEN